MAAQHLEYALIARRDPRRLILRSLGAAALFVSCAWVLPTAYRWNYYAEANRVQAVLDAAVPAGRVELGGYDDGPFEWRLVEALIKVDGSPNRTIVLHGPRAGELRAGKHLKVSAVGIYDFTIVTPDNYWSSRVDLGVAGPFTNSLPFGFRNVQDLVGRYDDLIAFLKLLPQRGHFPAKDGKSYAYEIKDHPNAPGRRVVIIRDPG